jgi:nucleotide-binding universal stress UspA family protein
MFRTVVLALDGSDASTPALDCAAGLAREHGSAVRVVHVIEIVAGRGAGTLHFDEAEIRERIQSQVEQLRAAGVDAELELHSAMAGAPAQVIADVAMRIGADLIVTGTRGRSTVSGIFLGSVSNRLLHLAHCPVLVVPDAARLHVAVGSAAATAS